MTIFQHPSFTSSYVVRFEGDALVCFMICGSDYIEVHRIPKGCTGELETLCLEQVDRCQDRAEEHAGHSLNWAWSIDDADARVCWSTR